MNIQSFVLATSVALVPATVALADDANKAALKKAKEAAKARARANAAPIIAWDQNPTPRGDFAKAEKRKHAYNLGAIERIQQVAQTTQNQGGQGGQAPPAGHRIAPAV